MVVQAEHLEDLRHWVDTNRKTALRVLDLVETALPRSVRPCW